MTRAHKKYFGAMAVVGVLAVAFGAIVNKRKDRERDPIAESLAAAVERCAVKHPKARDLLQSVDPQRLGLAKGSDAPVRLLEPIGVSLAERPRFRWRNDAGAKDLRLELSSDGVVIFEREVTGSEFAYPGDAAALARRSKATATLRYTTAAGPAVVTERFGVASDDAAALFDDIRSVIDAEVEDELRGLLSARAALRLGLLVEAADALESVGEGVRSTAHYSAIADFTRARIGRP